MNLNQQGKKVLNKPSNQVTSNSMVPESIKKSNEKIDPIFNLNVVPKPDSSLLETEASKNTLYSLFQQEINSLLTENEPDAGNSDSKKETSKYIIFKATHFE
jgi:hypothetical protein